MLGEAELLPVLLPDPVTLTVTLRLREGVPDVDMVLLELAP